MICNAVSSLSQEEQQAGDAGDPTSPWVKKNAQRTHAPYSSCPRKYPFKGELWS